MGIAYVLGDALDAARTVAADVLFESIRGSNEAPLKKAILAADLGGNVVSYTAPTYAKPYEIIILQNAKPDVADSCSSSCSTNVRAWCARAFRASALRP